MTREEARKEYRKIRNRSHCDSTKEFDKTVEKMVEDKSDHTEWVKAAKEAKFPCLRCWGTGRYIIRIENGRPYSNGGICYRCEGKSYQDDRDAVRNFTYDVYRLSSAE